MMKRAFSLYFTLFFSAFFVFSSPLEAGLWDTLKSMIWRTHTKCEPMIDVLIVNDQANILLEVRGRYQLIDPHTKTLLSKRYLGKKKHLEAVSSGLKWGEEFPGVFQLQIVPEDPRATLVVNEIEYHGSLYIYDIGGSISIVNRVPIEDFLQATITGKFSESLPEETHAAIAIAARTDAFYQSQNPKNRYWAVDGHVIGYRGLASQVSDEAMEQAIVSTRHMVLSKTGSYERVITPFPATWTTNDQERRTHQNGGAARISIAEAEQMALHGNHAAQILSKAFPGSHIEIIY